MDIPFIYSSLHATSRTVRDRPEVVQRMVAAFAEAIHYVDKNPVITKSAIAKIMRTKDEEALQVSYNVYTKDIVDRRMIVPGQAVNDSLELYRSLGTPVKRRAEDIYDNSFVNNLEKSGFQQELWGDETGEIGEGKEENVIPVLSNFSWSWRLRFVSVRNGHANPISPGPAKRRSACASRPARSPAGSSISTPPWKTICLRNTASDSNISISAAAGRLWRR
jgi:hypothetical protein